jgi:Beta-glucosidase/6-phospho-beta-glucosidase/beta-galactosidase
MKFLILLLIISPLIENVFNFSINETNFLTLGIHYDPTIRNNIEEDLIKIKEIGFDWIRLHISWKVVEREKGKFDYSIYDYTISLAKKLNLKIIAILGAGHTDLLPEWILKEGSVDNKDYINYLRIYAKNTVGRYSGKIDIWQIENELNHVTFYKWIGWRIGKWNETQIKNIIETLSSITKSLDKSAVMINVIVDNPNWFSFLRKLTEWNIEYDIIGIDYYPNYLDDYSEDAGNPLKASKVYDYINKAKLFNKTVVIAETGYSTYNQIHNEINQAIFVEKIALASIISSIGLVVYYRYDDFSYNSTDIEANFGFINYFGKPKLAWHKVKEIKVQKYNLKINIKNDQFLKSSEIKLDNIKVLVPIDLILFRTNINIKLEKEIRYNDILYKFEKIIINEKIYTNNEINLVINEDVSITIYYIPYYPLDLTVQTNTNYSLKAIVKINDSEYEIYENPIYLEGNKSYVIKTSRDNIFGQ